MDNTGIAVLRNQKCARLCIPVLIYVILFFGDEKAFLFIKFGLRHQRGGEHPQKG